MASNPARLRIGSVPYLVGRPLDSGLELEPGLEYRRAVPAELVRLLRAGELDVALVSSIELFRRPGYRYLDGLAVGGRGAVGSVQVFLKRQLEQLHSFALDPASRTSAVLARIELGARLGRAVRAVEVLPGADPALAEADAWLRIGDAALRDFLAARAPVFNPSEAWCRRTGLPFVFAAWVFRPGVEVERWTGVFERARARGRERVAELATEAAHAWQLPVADCRRYLEHECSYELGPQMGAALARFREEAARIGECSLEFDLEACRVA